MFIRLTPAAVVVVVAVEAVRRHRSRRHGLPGRGRFLRTGTRPGDRIS